MKRLLLYLYVITACICCTPRGGISDELFDPEEWKAWEEPTHTANSRRHMVPGLFAAYELTGMSRKEVVKLLGEPNFKVHGVHRYYLSYRGEEVSGSLVIRYEDGRVSGFAIW
ncbi:hypothetical protein AB9P05_21670 [Roseivirga sp. BDSF3-8]|uniref:hypothetical protein n=1 Tax=Roseivirga sp. BDSF3-8 TaxID=3241598 RepID=UPI003531D5DC